MKRSTWIIGLVALALPACAVSPEPASSTQDVSAISALPPDNADLAQPLTVTPDACVVGESCCPFPAGCSCDGEWLSCRADGTGRCIGAAPIGDDCP